MLASLLLNNNLDVTESFKVFGYLHFSLNIAFPRESDLIF